MTNPDQEDYTDEQIEQWNKEDLLPVPDNAPWLNLSPEEIEDLRNNKRTLTKYAREKLKALDLARKAMVEYKDALGELNDD